MPTYQYVCTECAEPLEVVQKFSDDPLTECPACQGRLRKVFSAAGIIFKGSGFYRTDSRGSNGSGTKAPAKSSSNGASSDSSGSSDSSSKSDAKPAATSSGDGGSAAKPTGSSSGAGEKVA